MRRKKRKGKNRTQSLRALNDSISVKVKKVNSLRWLFEPLETQPDFIEKRMFGCVAAYLGDKMVLVLADSNEPWNGILIPTERDLHSKIQAEFPNLSPHPILGKWLYLSQTSNDFEDTSTRIIEYLRFRDQRFGVLPKPKKKK